MSRVERNRQRYARALAWSVLAWIGRSIAAGLGLALLVLASLVLSLVVFVVVLGIWAAWIVETGP